MRHYRARYILEAVRWPHQYPRLFDITHHITIHDDGRITETHHECDLGRVDFNPPRIWDPNILNHYQLIEE